MTYIVAFEGIDGTGKGTQMQRAAQRLTDAGRRVDQLSFPMYDSFFGREIGKLLTGSEGVRANAVDGKSMALWFALDRFEALRSYRTAADILLINRYVLSNAVYQSIRDCDAGKPDLLDFVLSLEHEHFGIPRADTHLLFDMDLEQAAGNVRKKGYRDYVGGDGQDIYESIPDIQRRARLKYLNTRSSVPNVRIVPCMSEGRLDSIEAIGTRVDAVFQELGCCNGGIGIQKRSIPNWEWTAFYPVEIPLPDDRPSALHTLEPVGHLFGRGRHGQAAARRFAVLRPDVLPHLIHGRHDLVKRDQAGDAGKRHIGADHRVDGAQARSA